MYIFLQNLPTMNILDPIFYRTLFYDFRQWSPQECLLLTQSILQCCSISSTIWYLYNL
jgi:hypothetical protein